MDELCLICAEELDLANKVIVDNCKHEFCNECIGKWVVLNPICPLDRQNLSSVTVVCCDTKALIPKNLKCLILEEVRKMSQIISHDLVKYFLDIISNFFETKKSMEEIEVFLQKNSCSSRLKIDYCHESTYSDCTKTNEELKAMFQNLPPYIKHNDSFYEIISRKKIVLRNVRTHELENNKFIHESILDFSKYNKIVDNSSFVLLCIDIMKKETISNFDELLNNDSGNFPEKHSIHMNDLSVSIGSHIKRMNVVLENIKSLSLNGLIKSEEIKHRIFNMSKRGFCLICNEESTGKIIGMFPNCPHSVCVKCIKTWAIHSCQCPVNHDGDNSGFLFLKNLDQINNDDQLPLTMFWDYNIKDACIAIEEGYHRIMNDLLQSIDEYARVSGKALVKLRSETIDNEDKIIQLFSTNSKFIKDSQSIQISHMLDLQQINLQKFSHSSLPLSNEKHLPNVAFLNVLSTYSTEFMNIYNETCEMLKHISLYAVQRFHNESPTEMVSCEEEFQSIRQLLQMKGDELQNLQSILRGELEEKVDSIETLSEEVQNVLKQIQKFDI